MIFNNIMTIFIGILLEAIPFILLGSLISSFIQLFISENFIAKIIPKNIFLALFFTSLLGIIFPVCECAIIPITKKLINKGVPLSIAITFMLSVPIVNPIVIMSTYYAFATNHSIFIFRTLFGILNSIIIGLIIHKTQKNYPLPIRDKEVSYYEKCACGCDEITFNNFSKIRLVLNHTTIELFSVSKYLIFGAFISTLFKVLIPKEILTSFGGSPFLSIIVMIFLAFTLSVCSEADAFIASTFLGKFTTGSILSFLVLGPMLDIKNLLMLLGNFKVKFVIKLSLYILITTIITTFLFNIIGGLQL